MVNLGQRPYAELRRSEIIAFIVAIGDKTGQVTANRAHAIIRQILNYALKRDLIGANPALGIERMFPEVSRERVLNESEIRALWAFLRPRAQIAVKASRPVSDWASGR